jgi:hypothetical protein
MKISKKAFAFLILWLYGFTVFANTPNAAKDERVADSALAIDTSKGTVAVHQSLNDESRFYIAPNFKFLAVNAKGDVARLGATSVAKTDVIMKLRLVVAADRHEVAKALNVQQIWKVGNLPVNAIRVDLKTDALIEKYGIEQAYKIDSPAYTQTLDVVFSVASEQAKEFVRDVNQGKVAFQLTYAFNQINIDSHHEELSARFISDSNTLRRLDQQGKELMTAEQMADAAKSIRKEITSKVITSLGGKIEPRSIPVAKLMELFEVGDMLRKTEAELAEFDRRLAEQLNLRVNPKDFQPFRVQKHVIESLNSTKEVAKQRQSYVRNYNRNKTAWNVSASACADWGWGNACVSGGYATEAEKVSDKTAMSNDQFRDFVAKSHGVEYDTEERLFRGVKIYDTQKIKALGDVKVVSVTIKPTLTSGVKRLDLVPESQNRLYQGLVAYYPFDGNANDESAHGNDGVEHGGIEYVQGMISQAAKFNGTSTYINVPHDDSLNLQNITLSAWVYDYNHNGSSSMILLKGKWTTKGGQKRQYGFSSTYGSQAIADFGLFNVSGKWEGIRSTSHTPLNQWKHIVVTYDGQQQKMYLDGELHNSRNAAFDVFTPQNPESLTIGAGFTEHNTPLGPKDGLIDDLRIYNRALSDIEIQNLYQFNF